MTRTTRWACCVLMLGGFAAACTDEQETTKSAGEVSTVVTQDQRRQAGQTYFTELPNDGSIHCPNSEECPKTPEGVPGGPMGGRMPPWAGVLIPPKAVTPDSVVCVEGHNDNGAPCPRGWNGRLWRTHERDKNKRPARRDVQAVCLPNNKEDICAATPGDTDRDYGFFCRNPNHNCRGIPGKAPYGNPPKPEAETLIEGTQSGSGPALP